MVCGRQRAANLVVAATATLRHAGGGEAHFEGAPWNNNTVDMIRAAKGHLQLVLFQTFAESVKTMVAEVSVNSIPHTSSKQHNRLEQR